MHLQSVEIENFRGIRRLSLELDQVTFLIGSHGYGRTNLLEALMLCLAPPTLPDELVHVAEDDFHIPFDDDAPPANQLSIRLTFTESDTGQWNRPGFEIMQEVMVQGAGRRQITMCVVATRQDEGSAIVTDCRFLGANGTPLPARDPWMLLCEVRRLTPLIVLRSSKYFTRRWDLAAEAPPSRGLQNQVVALYERLSSAPHRLRRRDVEEGLRNVAEEVERWMERLDADQHMEPRLLQDIVENRLPLDSAAERAMFRQGSLQHRMALVVLLGAMLETRGRSDLPADSRPLLVVENLEAHLHPQMVATLWELLQAISVQKIVTTNSGSLLSAAPLRSVRRLVRHTEETRVHHLGEDDLTMSEMRRISYHVRVNRASALFAQCWLLVEGESEHWLLPEFARILGYDFAVEGVRCVEFAQCGVQPLIKIANAFGIEWHLLSDGDRAGNSYVKSARQLLDGTPESDRITQLEELDAENCLWRSGYAWVYYKAAGIAVNSAAARHAKPAKIIRQAVRRASKPWLALEVLEAANRIGPDGVPSGVRTAIETAVSLARSTTYY